MTSPGRTPDISHCNGRSTAAALPQLERRIGLAICLLVSCARAVCGQDVPSSSWFVRAGASPARIVSVNPFERRVNAPGEPINWVPNLTIEVGRQTDGSQDWHHLYRLPAWGFGFSVARFRNDVEHGEPLEAYSFFSYPFAHLNKRLDLTTDFGMGLSWHWQEVGEQVDSNAPVLGSDMNVRINWGFYLRYLMTARTSLYTGVDFTHRSNGGVVQPDRGINVLGPKVAMLYNFKPDASNHSIKPPPTFRPSWELDVGGQAGFKNVVERSSPVLRQDFGVFQATAELQRHFYRFGKIGGGTDLTYDGGTGAQADLINGVARQWRANAAERWSVGVYGGYEHVLGRFSPLVQVGYNAARGFDGGPTLPRLFGKYGWRYQFNDRFWGIFALRTVEARKADFLEFGVGYRIRWPRPDALGVAKR